MSRYISFIIGLTIIVSGYFAFGTTSLKALQSFEDEYIWSLLLFLSFCSGTWSLYNIHKTQDKKHKAHIYLNSYITIGGLLLFLFSLSWPTWDSFVAKMLALNVGIYPLYFLLGISIVLMIPIQSILSLYLFNKQIKEGRVICETLFSFSNLFLSFWVLKNINLFFGA